ncbi:MAG: hypothetical protein FD165_2467 [Gammaproteobacteria bacterium]|nr:MAG: hypothetical protein FD165_2467 [Gammaproteobacteria bacterium]TND02946.1 MAG: hypothetical protein FD120_2015 [Gammaproteobacteria bacterium]
MKLLIVSGLSGSGKTIALQVLEDLEYYCVDNLPAALLPAFAVQINDTRKHRVYDNVAVGIDARNIPEELREFPKFLEDIRKLGLATEIIFLEADENTLLMRFSETRRKHPLSTKKIALVEAMQQERVLLQPIRACADLHIDTSFTNVHELRDLIRERVVRESSSPISLSFLSFGYKHGIPADADFVFDLRCLPNPHWVPQLRALTGADPPVKAFLDEQTPALEMYQQIRDFLDKWLPAFEAENRSYLTVAIGCTGGQHRSVYMAERLADHFRQRYENVLVRHRELP